MRKKVTVYLSKHTQGGGKAQRGGADAQTNHKYGGGDKEEEGGLQPLSNQKRCSTQRVKLILFISKLLYRLLSRTLAVESGYVQITVHIVLHVNPVAWHCHCAGLGRAWHVFALSSFRESHVEFSRREKRTPPVDRES